MKTASIITIGDELLIGQTIDTNSAWIAQQFTKIGLPIKRRIAIADNAEEIISAMEQACKLSEIVIITGGLGPTSDDITKPTLCRYFNTELVLHEETLRQVESFFEKRGRPLLESNRLQAMLPKSCTVLKNEVGTAPGMLFEHSDSLVFSLPGVPFEMKHLIQERIIPLLSSRFFFKKITHKTLLTAGQGESFIAERLIHFEQQLPAEIHIAYLPSFGNVKIRLSTYEDIGKKIDDSFDELKQILADISLTDEDQSLERLIFNWLQHHNLSLAIAESCTGGYISHKFTSISGASTIFKGAAVCYAVESKHDVLGVRQESLDTYTAISSEVAIEMAEQAKAKYKSDYSIATTGYLEGKETFFYCAISGPKSTIVKRWDLPLDRALNLELASAYALQFLAKYLKKMLGL